MGREVLSGVPKLKDAGVCLTEMSFIHAQGTVSEAVSSVLMNEPHSTSQGSLSRNAIKPRFNLWAGVNIVTTGSQAPFPILTQTPIVP